MVMTSRWYEGFPMPTLESALHYKAVIAPDHGGFTKIIGEAEMPLDCFSSLEIQMHLIKQSISYRMTKI